MFTFFEPGDLDLLFRAEDRFLESQVHIVTDVSPGTRPVPRTSAGLACRKPGKAIHEVENVIQATEAKSFRIEAPRAAARASHAKAFIARTLVRVAQSLLEGN